MSGPSGGAKRHAVRVSIMGEEYTLRSDASPEHTQAVADYLDRAIRRITGSGNVIDTHKAAILAALSITDELFRERAGHERMAELLRTLGDEIRPLLPPAKRGDPAPGGQP